MNYPSHDCLLTAACNTNVTNNAQSLPRAGFSLGQNGRALSPVVLGPALLFPTSALWSLEQFQEQNFVKNSANMPLRESSYCFCEPTLFSVLLLHCFESQSNGLFLTSKRMFHFVCRSVSYYSVLKIYLARFTSRKKRNTLKGFVIHSSRKKQFVQQRELPKRAMSAGKQADSSFLFSSKTQE